MKRFLQLMMVFGLVVILAACSGTNSTTSTDSKDVTENTAVTQTDDESDSSTDNVAEGEDQSLDTITQDTPASDIVSPTSSYARELAKGYWDDPNTFRLKDYLSNFFKENQVNFCYNDGNPANCLQATSYEPMLKLYVISVYGNDDTIDDNPSVLSYVYEDVTYISSDKDSRLICARPGKSEFLVREKTLEALFDTVDKALATPDASPFEGTGYHYV